jgi:hypothetical protein
LAVEGQHLPATNTYYTSLELANIHLDYDTHLFGRLHSNRKINPHEVVATKPKKGDLVAMGNSTGNMVVKWHNKRDVTLLSTCH